MRRSVASIVVVLGLVGGAVLGVVLTGTTPKLGLDLQGGLSVVLAPTGEFESEGVDKALDIIRDRVDALGVAEPAIARQGDTVVVDLPGVKEQGRAKELIGRTAKLQFRSLLAEPVPLALIGPGGGEPETPAPTGGEPSPPGTQVPAGDTEPVGGAWGGQVVLGQVEEQPPPEQTTTTVAEEAEDAEDAGEGLPPGCPVPGEIADDPAQPLIACDKDGVLLYNLGPAELTGEVVQTARASFGQGGWGVDVDFTSEGSSQWDGLAARFVNQPIAIVLDGVVQSAPTIQEQAFGGSARISGNFGEGESKDLALVLRFGALPVELEEISVQEVSASLGRDQLRSGLVAGVIGLGLVALYMIAYYRVLGFVVWLSLVVTGGAVYAIVSWLGEEISLTLTLAGVVGLIVAIGVAVDSNIVYFERVKEEARSGRSVRSAAERGFQKAFRTIVAADIVTLLGAGFLWLLAVGSVRGFAFYLGLVTVLDLVVSYFFMYPLVVVIGRSARLRRARWLGLHRVLGEAAVTP